MNKKIYIILPHKDQFINESSCWISLNLGEGFNYRSLLLRAKYKYLVQQKIQKIFLLKKIIQILRYQKSKY